MDVFNFGDSYSDHFGSIIATLRKGKITFKWPELSYHQQLIFVGHIDFFGVSKYAADYSAPAAPKPEMGALADDDLEMPEAGCAWCGTTAHSTEQCTRFTGNKPAADAAAAPQDSNAAES
jgi:hypothetical protein